MIIDDVVYPSSELVSSDWGKIELASNREQVFVDSMESLLDSDTDVCSFFISVAS
jgi:hypothetical protein